MWLQRLIRIRHEKNLKDRPAICDENGRVQTLSALNELLHEALMCIYSKDPSFSSRTFITVCLMTSKASMMPSPYSSKDLIHKHYQKEIMWLILIQSIDGWKKKKLEGPDHAWQWSKIMQMLICNVNRFYQLTLKPCEQHTKWKCGKTIHERKCMRSRFHIHVAGCSR